MPNQKGSMKALQEILRGIEARNPDVDFPRTSTGKYETRQETLVPLADREMFIANYLQFKAVEKLLGTFVKKLGSSAIHPSFNPLVTTGRTSSYGEINAQNLPRDDRVRQCFVAPPGKVYVVADYSAIEMATLGQAIQGQLGFQSALVEAINLGHDVHRRMAAKMTGKCPEEITKEERQRAKAINFGKPGGMGNASLIRYAKASYGVMLSEEEAESFSDAWLDEWPEMTEFLDRTDDIGEEIAKLLSLTPQRHFDATMDNRFWCYAEREGRLNQPSPPLGGMFLKAMREAQPRTREDVLYPESDLDFFWDAAKANIDLLPSNMHAAVLNRRPSPKLSQAFMRPVGRRSVFTLTGRLRAKASFCAQRNTLFQGLAADGAKMAMWHIWRAGYVIHNFIHDEFIVAVPDGPLVGFHAQVIKQLMIAGMQQVVPDVRIGVEYVVTKRWSKQAKLLRDAVGKVQAWDLPAEGVIGETISKKVTNLAMPKTKIVVKVRPKGLAPGAGNPKAT